MPIARTVSRGTALAAAAAAAVMALAGCGTGGEQAQANAATAFVPPAVAPAAPLPGQGHTTPLSVYAGHYPRDAVDGVGFFDRTEVAMALDAAVGDPKLRQRVVAADGVAVPIFRSGASLAAYACEPHDCGDHNWTLFVPDDPRGGRVCHHDAATMGDTSRWYADGRAPVTRPGACPSTAADVDA